MLFYVARCSTWLRNPRARHLVAACGVAIGVIIAAATTFLVMSARRDALADAERELHNTAYILAAETDRRFQGAEELQLALLNTLRSRGVDSPEALAGDMALPSTSQELRQRATAVPGIDCLSVLDNAGTLLASSYLSPPRGSRLADRDYVRALLANPRRGWFIGAPEQSANGTWTLTLAYAFTGRNGRLLGIIGTGIRIRSFESVFAGILLSRGSSVALFRNDGVLLARYPPKQGMIGRSFGVAAEYRAAQAPGASGIVHRRSLLDGRERLIAPRDVPDYPLVVSATAAMQSVLADWRLLARWLVGGTALTELVLAAIVALAVRQLHDQERLNAAYAARLEAEAGRALAESERDRARDRAQHERAARLEALRFDTAISNMRQGLVMFDGERRLLVVNARFNELCGLAPGVLHPGMSYDAFTQALATHGTVPAIDLAALISHRVEMVSQQVQAGFVWEMSDGRTFAISHQPMEEGWVATYDDISASRQIDARIAYVARHDTLTGLPNRVLFRERLEVALARRAPMAALICLDLDQFKAVNDTLGHPTGDALLQAVAQRLQQEVRDADNIARLGSDEFAVIQPAIEKPDDAAALAGRLIQALHEPFEVGGQPIVIGISIGIAFAPQDGTEPDALLRNADLALHRAKAEGRGNYRVFHAGMDAELQARREMEIELRAALPAGQLALFFQPLISAGTGTVAGFEALLRWHHPEKGLVPPGLFIPLAEESGLILPIGEWVLHEACRHAASWPQGIHVAVNLSAVQFKGHDLVAAVASALHGSGLPPERLELEITESVMLQDTAATLATLRALQALGVHIAMDDFGTGYSSLSYLRRFPFNRIKIDQAFVRDLATQRDSSAIVRAVLAMSHELGIATTAEGVETEQQLRILTAAGCSDIQGYLFSPPVPAAEVPALLREAPAWAVLLRPSLAA